MTVLPKECISPARAPEDLLRCPYSGLPLVVTEEQISSVKHTYSRIGGFLNLVLEEKLDPLDTFFQKQYGKKTASRYDQVLKTQSVLFGCWEPAQRRNLVRLLNPPPGGLVLEVAVGTGANLPLIAKAIGPEGLIIGLDLSVEMLKAAQRRTEKAVLPVHLIRADGCHLPFADDSFDAVFHFGGINMFGDLARGIEEMIRVAKPKAPLVISDEGMSERRRKTWTGRQLAKINSLYLCRPPFPKIPWAKISQFELHWAWRELFYVFRFCKGTEKKHGPVSTAPEEIQRRTGLQTEERAGMLINKPKRSPSQKRAFY